VPAFPFEYKFLDATYEKIYQNETRLSKIFGYFAILAVIISCLGLFGLASFMAEQRTKEIGIRKVLGSSIAQIIVLQQREFLWLVAIANIIAWPLAWYFMKTYLDTFAFKITLSASIFIIAGFLSLLITFLTVFFLAYNAAIRDPVNAIKYE
jgi:ABC-type antimicrobial peptide transport system permease subunit